MQEACRRLPLCAVVTIASVLCSSVYAQTQYPVKPIRYIVPFAPGGGADILARVIGQKLSERWGQPVIVDNRPGASGNTATAMVAKTAADGYTVISATSSFVINPSLFTSISYDAIKDFAPICLVAFSPYILVVPPTVPVSSVKELIAYAKSRPNQLNYGSSGSGIDNHLGMEQLKAMAGMEVTHVPYKGTTPLLTDLLGGRVQMALGINVGVLPHIQTGRLKALAISSGKRSPVIPDLPTIAEAGFPGFEVLAWYGVVAPAATPAGVVGKFNAELVSIVRTPEFTERLTRDGAIPIGSSPQEFGEFIKVELARWAKVVKESGARVE